MDGVALNIGGELAGQSSPSDARSASSAEASGATDAAAMLRQTFEQCGDDLYRFIVLRVNGDRHAADDLLQQTCYEAARYRRIPAGDDAAQAWLFGIAKNLIHRHFRHVKRDARIRINGAAASTNTRPVQSNEDPESAHGCGELTAPLLSAMAALDEDDQQLLLGCYFEGRTHEELAQAMGLSVRAIEGRLYRARAALRETLQERLGENES